jgi:4-hydroxybenzoate polyprenyltransferase
MNIVNYFKAVRPMTMLFFFEVVLGALYSLNFSFSVLDLLKLISIFVSFESIYRGIYVINDLVDYKTDRKHPRKSKRIIASGKISRRNASIFAVCLIFIGFIIGLFTSLTLVYFEIFFLCYNILYSFILKIVPIIDTFAGGVTHAMRFVLGIVLFGQFTSYYLAVSIFLLASGLFFLKRFKEHKDHRETRPAIKYYSIKKIKLIWLILGFIILYLVLFAKNFEKIAIVITFLLYALVILGYFKITKIQNIANKIMNY